MLVNSDVRNPLAGEGSQILEVNEIGAIWQICFIANCFVFPIYARFEKEHAISRMEFVVLYVMAHRANMMAWEICRMTGLPKNNISRGVQKLEQKKLITRTSDPKDARRSLLKLTASGKKLYKNLVEQYSERADSFLALLDEKDRSDLDRITVKLAKSIAELQ